MTYTFTVCTPTFNREHTIKRTFDALRNQTFKDFEWLVVDDGSTDNTESLIQEFTRLADFPIRYLHKPNGGKHTAINLGVTVAEGELFIILDSDDACVPNALETLNDAWQEIEDKSKFAGLNSLSMDQHGETLGTQYPDSWVNGDFDEIPYLDYKYKYDMSGEKWGFHRTSVLREFPFPEPDDIKFIVETTVWDQIAKKYPKRFINVALEIYHVPEASEDNLSNVSEITKRGHAYSNLIKLNSQIYKPITRSLWKVYLTSVVNVIRYGEPRLFWSLTSLFDKIVYILMIPVGWYYRQKLST